MLSREARSLQPSPPANHPLSQVEGAEGPPTGVAGRLLAPETRAA